MQHAVLDLLGAALIPELGADIATGAAGNVQLVLVAVAAPKRSRTACCICNYDSNALHFVLGITAENFFYFTFGAACGPLQTYFHRKGRNGRLPFLCKVQESYYELRNHQIL